MSHTNTFVWDLNCLLFFPPSVNNTDQNSDPRNMEAKKGLGKGEKDQRPLSKHTGEELEGDHEALAPQQGSSRLTGQAAFHHLRILKQSRTDGPGFRRYALFLAYP